MPIQSIPYILLLGVLFGSTLIASRFSVGQFAPSTYIGLRLSLASLCYLALYLFSFQGRKFPRGRNLWRHGSMLGIFGTAIPMNFIVLSLQYQSSGLTSILITISPAITVLMAHFLLPDEPLTGRKTLGVALALLGALLLALLGESGLPDVSQPSPLGYLLVLSAMVFGSGMTIYARKYMREMDTFDVSAIRLVTAAVVVLPLSALLIGVDLSQVNRQGYLAFGWATLAGTFLGMLVAFYNIKRFGATASAMTAYVIPVVASIGGVILLGEQVTAGMFGSMALILGGIAIINQRRANGGTPVSG